MRSTRQPRTAVMIFACFLGGLAGYAAQGAATGATLTEATYHDLKAEEFMTRWLVLGPVPVLENQGDAGNREAQKKSFETVPFSMADFQPQVTIGGKEWAWTSVQAESGLISLVRTFGPKEYVAAYAWAQIDMPEERSVILGLASDDAARVWLNGQPVHENWVFRAAAPDSDLVPLVLKKGPNQLVLKIQNGQGDWGFACRLLGPPSLARALVTAAGQGKLETIKLLVGHGVDVNARIGPGLTALHSAKIRGQKAAADLLRQAGADPNLALPAREKIVDMIFRQTIRDDSPGAAVAILQNGSVVYQNGYGLANLEYGIPITPVTVFHVASVSKQFTAFAAVLLAQEGKLSLDDDIRQYLPEMPDFGKTITLRHLIHHTSGLRDQWELLAMAGWRLDDVITKEHILKTIRHEKELNFDPGQEHLYCNTGYTLLAEIVERVAGQPFREYTRTHIFQPLNMVDTHFHDDHEMIVKNRAYSYAPQGDGFKASVLSYANAGATSLFTTVADLARWMRNFEDSRVGGTAALEQMRRPGVLSNGQKLDYACGLVLGKYRGLQTVGHSGGDAGYRSEVVWFPDQRFGVAVLSNLGSMNPGDLARQVAEVYLMDRLEPQTTVVPKAEPTAAGEPQTKVDPKVYDDYVGKYQLPGVVIAITKEGERLMGQATNQAQFELVAQSETAFLVKGEEAIRMTFGKGQSGRVTQLIVNQAGSEYTAQRVEGAPPGPGQLGEFAGDYYSEELGTTYTLVVQNDKLVAQHRRHNDIAVTAVESDLFQGDAWWFGQVHFLRGPDRAITGFRLTGGRVRNLWFEKRPRSSPTR